MNAAWKVEKAQYAEFNVPTCGKIAVWQLCRETQPLWNSHDSSRPALNMLRINAMVFVSMAQAPPKAGAKEVSVQESKFSLDAFQHPCFRTEGDFCSFAKYGDENGVLTEKHASHVDISVFQMVDASNTQDSPKASPRVYCQIEKTS